MSLSLIFSPGPSAEFLVINPTLVNVFWFPIDTYIDLPDHMGHTRLDMNINYLHKSHFNSIHIILRVVRNFLSRGRIGRSRGRNSLLFNRNIAQNVLNCEKVGGTSDKSRRGFRPPPPLADNPVKILFAGKTKCMMKTGDCIIKHPGVFTTGLQMVVCLYLNIYFLFFGNKSLRSLIGIENLNHG